MKGGTLLLCALLSGCSTLPAGKGAQVPAAPLHNTHWRLTQLAGEPIDNPSDARDVHMVLQTPNAVVTGHSGCNRMFGTYVLDGDSITFQQMGGTRMFCQARMELEQKYLAMFATVARWKLAGQTLELLDANGAAVAAFEAPPATG